MFTFLDVATLICEQCVEFFKNSSVMLTFACVVYVFMCWISGWNLFWPLTLLFEGALGDKIIAIGWGALLIAGLN